MCRRRFKLLNSFTLHSSSRGRRTPNKDSLPITCEETEAERLHSFAQKYTQFTRNQKLTWTVCCSVHGVTPFLMPCLSHVNVPLVSDAVRIPSQGGRTLLATADLPAGQKSTQQTGEQNSPYPSLLL